MAGVSRFSQIISALHLAEGGGSRYDLGVIKSRKILSYRRRLSPFRFAASPPDLKEESMRRVWQCLLLATFVFGFATVPGCTASRLSEDAANQQEGAGEETEEESENETDEGGGTDTDN